MQKNIFRKLVLLQCAAILSFSAHAVYAGVDVNINLGVQPRQVYVPEPAYVPQPVYAQPVYAQPVAVINVEEDIQFVYPDSLGFYVAVGVPYDLIYLQNSYFLFRDGRWLRAPNSRGPWVAQRNRDLPPSLRRYRVDRIREFRNREYVIYNRDRDHYRGKHFRSDKEQWKEHRKDVKEQRKDEKRYEKEGRKEEKRYDKEQRKDDKRYDKEQRKDDKRYDKEQRKDDKRSEKEDRREHREGRGD